MSIANSQTRVLTDATNALIDASLRAGQAIRFTITTPSMIPTLRPGDQVIVRGTRPEELRLGDIVLVQSGESRMAHRLIGWCNVDGAKCLVTKGDNSWVADLACSPTDFCGIIIMVQRGKRRVNLRSGWARGVNRWLAMLSRGEKIVYHPQPGLFRRSVLKGMRVSLRAGVAVQFRMAQEITA
jgi:signal peptidase I